MSAIVMTESDFSAALLDPGRDCPPPVVAWNGSDPATRFAIHRNNVVSSLIDALADTFPVAQRLVGIEFFRAMTSIFVRLSPPRSSVLALYGQALPDFIDRFEPARSVPYLADVARLEYARVVSYHAADADALSHEEVIRALGMAERADALLLGCHPSLIEFQASNAAVSIWAAHQDDENLESIDVERPEACLVTRDALVVLVLPVPASATTFVRSIRRGARLGQAAFKAHQVDANFDLAATLTLLMRHGALTSMQIPESEPL